MKKLVALASLLFLVCGCKKADQAPQVVQPVEIIKLATSERLVGYTEGSYTTSNCTYNRKIFTTYDIVNKYFKVYYLEDGNLIYKYQIDTGFHE